MPAGCAQVRAQQGSAEMLALAHSELLWRDFFRFTAKKYACARLAPAAQQQAGAPGCGAGAVGGALPAAMPSLALAAA